MGVGGKGNEGVAGLVRQLPGAIGYVELIYALQNKISYGEVKNASGNWVKASIEGVTAAAASIKTLPADYQRLHHQRAGRNLLSNLQLYLSADPRSCSRSGQGQGYQGPVELDRQLRRERGLRALLCAVASQSGAKGTQDHLRVAIETRWQVRPLRLTCSCSAKSLKPSH